MGKEVMEKILLASAYMRLIFGLEERVIEHSFLFQEW
jgi:hypothetical protein